MIQIIDLLSGKAYTVCTRATATAAAAAEIICDTCLRSSNCFPDVLLVDHNPNVVDHNPKFTRYVFRAFAKGMG